MIAFALTYVATAMFALTLPVLDPSTGVWRWATRPSPIEIRYYGQLAAAGLVAVAATVPAAWLARGRLAAPTTDVDRLFAGWAAVATLLCLAYFAWHNWP